MLNRSSDGKARRIAAEWQAPDSVGITSFASNGMIDDRVEREVQVEIDYLRSAAASEIVPSPYRVAALSDLTFLQAYLATAGHRTPVDGWSRIWG